MTPRHSLARCARVVRAELDGLGLWKHVRRTEIVWCALPQLPLLALGFFTQETGWLSRAAGYQEGHIYIPAICFSRRNLRNVLRHEYGHAVAYYRPGPFASRNFRAAFGAPYLSDAPTDRQKREDCVSDYATTLPMEDFAETFMLFVSRRGTPPPRTTPGLRRKWEFIRSL